MDIVNGGIGLSIVPSYPERVFRANVGRPRQRIVGLDEIVVSFDGTVWFDTLEEA
jgi:adenosyl cobinamide kinase/adenosyl cobinamide phosphate guanylyltransferase